MLSITICRELRCQHLGHNDLYSVPVCVLMGRPPRCIEKCPDVNKVGGF